MELPAWRKLGANLNLADAGGYFKTIFKNSSCPTFSSPRDLIFCAMTALITFHLNHFIPTQSFFLCSKILEILAGKLGSHKTKTKFTPKRTQYNEGTGALLGNAAWTSTRVKYKWHGGAILAC